MLILQCESVKKKASYFKANIIFLNLQMILRLALINILIT